MYIYDGPDVNAPLIGAFNNSSDPTLYLELVEASLTNTSGCLTVHFVSDGADEGQGWHAEIQCSTQCQDIIAHLDPTLTDPPSDTNYIAICPNQTITFSGYAEYPENNLIYHQSDATSIFTWYFGDGTSEVGQTVSHTYDVIGGYTVTLFVTDTTDCVNANSIETRIVIAGNPIGDIITPMDICAHDTAYLIYSVDSGQTIEGTPFQTEITTTLGVSDTVFLPDGTGDCYETSVVFNCFDPGQTLENPQDFLNLAVNMEHSFLGDLGISIICPNGQTLLLHEFTNGGSGGGTFLGEAIDDDSDLTAGVGYDYSWTPITPTYGTMTDESDAVSTLLEGSYTPDGTFADLVGCPLNGQWTIEICDNWASDNGYIFSWQMTLNPDIAPDSWSYTVAIDDLAWTDGPNIISQNDTMAVVVPPSDGTYTYTYTLTDHYGCVWDTTTTVTAIPAPDLNLGPDQVICDASQSVILDAGAADAYIWAGGETTQTITASMATTYYVTATLGLCDATDEVNIEYSNGVNLSTMQNNITCFDTTDGSISVNVVSDYLPVTYLWNNAATTSTISNLGIGTYIVTVTDYIGCVDTIEATITQPTKLIETYTFIPVSCFGDEDGEININVTGGTMPYSYVWSNELSSSLITSLGAGSYTVTIKDANGCMLEENINISEPNDVIVSLPDDFLVCKNTIYTLTNSVSGGAFPYSYNWNTTETTDDIQYSINTETNYSLTVTDSHGCTGANDVVISVIPDIQIDASIDRDIVCEGDPVVITGGYIGGAAPYTYYLNGSLINLPHSVYPNGQTSYSLIIEDECGMTDKQIFELNTHPQTPLSFSANVLAGCMPLSVVFNVHNPILNADYYWTFGDAVSNDKVTNPNHIYENSGLFDVAVEVIDANGCLNSKDIIGLINVHPLPEARFNATPEVVTILDPVVEFVNLSTKNDFNHWQLGDGVQSNLTTPYHSYSEIGIYKVNLFVETKYGCIDSASTVIEVKDEYTLYIPTAFSPDGDGINDTFFAKGHGIDTDGFSLKVYDRWGEVIWATNDIYETWNGTVKGLGLATSGTYICYVVCKDFLGIEHTVSEKVTIIK